MNKRIIIFKIIIVFIVALLSYPFIGKMYLSNKTRNFLEIQGCFKNDIKNIKVVHSYLNKILGYAEWNILVEFVSEPKIKYSFTPNNSQIVFRGVIDHTKSKEELKTLEDKFIDGELYEANP